MGRFKKGAWVEQPSIKYLCPKCGDLGECSTIRGGFKCRHCNTNLILTDIESYTIERLNRMRFGKPFNKQLRDHK